MVTALRKRRLLFLAPALLSLVAGVVIGLVRLGWRLPLPHEGALAVHGPLMVGGFLGTLIGLERAVALGRRWAFAGPFFSLAAAAVLVAAPDAPAAPVLMALASAVLVAAYGAVLRRQRALATWTMALGAVLWLASNLLAVGGYGPTRLAPWWMGFLVLTIAGERLELARVLPPHRLVVPGFVGALALVVAGLIAGTALPRLALPLLGPGLLLLAAWLLRFDVARRTVRTPGLPRFVAVCLLCGYVWLALAGMMALAHTAGAPGSLFDAIVHAVMLGFVLSMVFGHAPIILPAVLGVALRVRATFWIHVALLHVSLVLRVAADLDLAWSDGGLGWARPWGALLNGAAVAVFLANTASSVARRA